MTKAEMIEKAAKDSGMTKAAAAKAIDSVFSQIAANLKKGKSVMLSGFGTFRITKRKARNGRNPRNGAAIKIAASKTVKFSASGLLKKTLNK
ncbi:MAG: HU family DNA-binding protein [Nitrospirae bacterium]|nr:HU family DNA-binding protein [Nitrospirota bacterium]